MRTNIRSGIKTFSKSRPKGANGVYTIAGERFGVSSSTVSAWHRAYIAGTPKVKGGSDNPKMIFKKELHDRIIAFCEKEFEKYFK